jgi:hypothetical protein
MDLEGVLSSVVEVSGLFGLVGGLSERERRQGDLARAEVNLGVVGLVIATK